MKNHSTQGKTPKQQEFSEKMTLFAVIATTVLLISLISYNVTVHGI
jgi:hypothetical protein